MALGIALRYVLEALRKPHNSKMYLFGIAALDKFKNRLKDYPQYCQHLASIPHFAEFPVALNEVSIGGSCQCCHSQQLNDIWNIDKFFFTNRILADLDCL